MKSSKLPSCPYQYVVIEGNIGAGKTSLATKISQDYRAKLILERFAENPFLEKFYQNPDRYALSLEMAFLTDRYHQLKDELQSGDMFHPFFVSDYYFTKSLIFARNTLSGDEFHLYAQLFHIIHSSLPKPDLYVYLHLDTKQLLWNIQNRGRAYEKVITADYLDSIRSSYFEYLKQQSEMRIALVDTRNLDFIVHEEHYHLLLETIFNRDLSPGITRLFPNTDG
ncbi:MAG: deoxynucleoside kinase [Bacteroidales bacterium]|nr:deoxynucleoside kinase [Bacteroidales bacterium]